MSLLAVTSMVAALAAPQVELRGERDAQRGPIVSVGLQGVTVDEGGERLIPWPRIRDVEGEWAEEAEPFLPYAEHAWRAGERLRRGDAVGAEPLFEELFHAYAWRRGETSAMVVEGLLRARLRRGAQPAAVEAWLALLHAWSGEGEIEQADPPIVDAPTGLAPGLPPIWLDDPAVRAFAERAGPDAGEGEMGERARALWNWYKVAAAFEAGVPYDLPEGRSSHPGVSLVRDVVLARAGDFEQRRTARAALERRLDSARGTWTEAWCRAAIGRSLLLEAEDEQRMRGILHLLHLPVRFGAEHPHLAGLALAEAAVAMDELGDPAAAAALKADLRARYADHPALGADRVRRIGEGGAASGASHDQARGDR